jgi:hypothetical protein
MGGLYEQFSTDSDLEKNGIVLMYMPNSKGIPIEIRIARAGGANKAYLRALEIKSRPYRKLIDTGMMDVTVANDIMRDVYAETIVLGWENVEDRDGNPLPYTKENCKKLLKDLPVLYDDIVEQAQRISLFKRAEIEDDSKN